MDASQHQQQTRGANPAGTSSGRAISNPTEGRRGGSSKTQKTESQKVKPIKKPQLTIRPRTDRDLTPTAGELRETYRRKSTFGDKMGLDEIEKVGLEINRVYQQTHPDWEKAPDDFKHPDVWIDGKSDVGARALRGKLPPQSSLGNLSTPLRSGQWSINR